VLLTVTMSLKEEKEAFVTGHEGTTVAELLLVCLSAPIGIWLLSKCQTTSDARRAAAEALFVLIPMMIVQTNLLYPWGVSILAIEMVFAIWLQFTQAQKQQAARPHRLVSLTCFRSSVMYFTFVAILAVDFSLFPRRFCKTEVTGYGLMDLGAGSFVVAAGLLPHNKVQQLWKRILPLVILGMIRCAANKGLDYQEHMSEYGIHWNFFLTLAVVTPLASWFVSSEATLSLCWKVPLGITLCYQYALSNGLQEYIETAPRMCESTAPLCNLLAANREGILGCIGYLSIYLTSYYIGRICLWNNVDNPQQRQSMLYEATAVLWLLAFLLAQAIPVSRRSTNVTFCVWTLAHNTLLLALLEAATSSMTSPPIFMNAMNRHGLLVFVVANLLTGLVNLTFDTLHASDAIALVLLTMYLSCVCGFAVLLDPVLALLRHRGRSKTN
jgi:phosphatidylinositol glycan class W